MKQTGAIKILLKWKVEKMNEFKLLGRLNWLKIQYFDNGTCMTSIYLAKKLMPAQISKLPANHKAEEEYETYTIIFFNTQKDNVAERIAETCKQGDYLRVSGKLSINNYSSKDEKKRKKLELIGWNFKKVCWDGENNKYVDCEDETQEFA